MAAETHCISIQIVGTTEGGERFGEELAALFERLQQILPETMPGLVMAHPPATITTFEVFGTIPAKRVDLVLSQTQSELIAAARTAVDAIKGDGNGHCWIKASAADQLRAAVERWEQLP